MTSSTVSSELVSVVLPVYNGERFIAECLDNLSEQTYRPFECVVADDGSSDRTAQIASAHPLRPRILRAPHRNLAAARNAGVAGARGSLVAFIDVDDLWLPGKLAKQVSLLMRTGDSLVFTKIVRTDASGGAVKLRRAPLQSWLFNTGNQVRALLRSNIITPSSVLVRRAALEALGGFDEQLAACEDWDLWLRMAARGLRLRYLGEPLTIYRTHGDNMSANVERMHAHRMAVLERFFAAHEDSSAVRRLRKEAFARACYEAANAGYRRGPEVFLKYYRMARTYSIAPLSVKALRRYIREVLRGSLL